MLAASGDKPETPSRFPANSTQTGVDAWEGKMAKQDKDNKTVSDPIDELLPEDDIKPAVIDEPVDFGSLEDTDLKPISMEEVKVAHPFEGYPYKKIKIPGFVYGKGTKPKSLIGKPATIYAHEIVLLSPAFEPEQDVSAKASGRETFHSRMLVDYDDRKQNVDTVFDRVGTLDGTAYKLAIVKSHSIRAQIMFELRKDNEGTATGIKPDRRYLLYDKNQVKPLTRLFDMQIYKPHQKRDANVRRVVGE